MSSSLISARYMILSSAGFALMGFCVKLAGEQGIPVLEIIAARALVSLVLSYLTIRHKKISIWGHQRGLLFARGLAGTLALICVYYALLHMPFAEATVIQYLNPLFTALLAAIFLHEKLQKTVLLAMGLSMLGLLLVVQPDAVFATREVTWSLWVTFIALLGAVGSAIAYVLVRKLAAKDDPAVIIFYFPLVALPVALLVLGDDFVMPQGWTWLVLLLVGVFTQLGQWGLTKSIQIAPAGKAMSFSYLQIVFALFLGVVFFDEVPNIYTIFGILTIISATMLSAFKK